MSAATLVRAQQLHQLALRASYRGISSLTDDELLHLLAEHRWALATLARQSGSLELRSLLNAAALLVHGVLHRRTQPQPLALGCALRRVAPSLAVSALVFFGSGAIAATAVLADPMLAFALVPRELLLQIGTHAWGARGSTSMDVGMTLFYWANNLRASFLALGLGVLAGVPALGVIAFNGMLLGSVLGAALNGHVGDRLLGWVAPHGVPELGALVLCGAIGLELGKSWLRPGCRKRRVALAECGRTLTPLVVLAAILVLSAAPLEGFVAPLELPVWLDVGIATGWMLVLTAGAGYALCAEGSKARVLWRRRTSREPVQKPTSVERQPSRYGGRRGSDSGGSPHREQPRI